MRINKNKRLAQTFRDVFLSKALVILVSVGAILNSGCSIIERKQPELREVVLTREAPVPEGAMRQCWEEPLVVTEHNGPGLDADGHWYHPSYTAVREVRQGRWRPCEPVSGDAIRRN